MHEPSAPEAGRANPSHTPTRNELAPLPKGLLGAIHEWGTVARGAPLSTWRAFAARSPPRKGLLGPSACFAPRSVAGVGMGSRLFPRLPPSRMALGRDRSSWQPPPLTGRHEFAPQRVVVASRTLAQKLLSRPTAYRRRTPVLPHAQAPARSFAPPMQLHIPPMLRALCAALLCVSAIGQGSSTPLIAFSLLDAGAGVTNWGSCSGVSATLSSDASFAAAGGLTGQLISSSQPCGAGAQSTSISVWIAKSAIPGVWDSGGWHYGGIFLWGGRTSAGGGLYSNLYAQGNTPPGVFYAPSWCGPRWGCVGTQIGASNEFDVVPIRDSNYHHLVYNFGAVNNIFLDGTLRWTAPADFAMTVSPGFISFGNDGGHCLLCITLRDVRVFDHALSAAEAAQLTSSGMMQEPWSGTSTPSASQTATPSSSQTLTPSSSQTSTASSSQTATASPSHSSTPSYSQTATASSSQTATASASQTSTLSSSQTTTPTITLTPGLACPSSLFRGLPRTDLVGSPLTDTPLEVTSEGACRIACCGAPGCDGYAFAFTELRFSATASCSLYANVSATAPNSFAVSGMRIGVMLPSSSASASSAPTSSPVALLVSSIVISHPGSGSNPSACGAGYINLAEIELLNVSGENCALAGIATASSQHYGYPPIYINDGDRATFWNSANEDSPWVRIQLPYPCSAVSLRVWGRPGGGSCQSRDIGDTVTLLSASGDAVLLTTISGFENDRWVAAPLLPSPSPSVLPSPHASASPAGTSLSQSAGRPHTGSLTPSQTPSVRRTAWEFYARTNIADVPGSNGPCATQGMPQGNFPSPDRSGSWGGYFCSYSSLATAQEVCIAAPFCCGVIEMNGAFEPRRGREDGSCILYSYAEGASPWGVDVGSWLRIHPSPTPLSTPNFYCSPSFFRLLPRMDLVGSLVGTALSPGAPVPLPSESSCRQACCDAPACDGYAFASGDVSFINGGPAGCFLYVNITQLIPSSFASSGIYESTL